MKRASIKVQTLQMFSEEINKCGDVKGLKNDVMVRNITGVSSYFDG